MTPDFEEVPSNFISKFAKFINEKKKKQIAIVVGLILLAVIVVALFSNIKKNVTLQENPLVNSLDEYFSLPYVPDQLIVRLKNNYSEQDLTDLKNNFDKLGVISQQKAYESNADYLKDYYILQFKQGTNIKTVKQTLDDAGLLMTSHPNYIFSIQDPGSPSDQLINPNDQYYSLQWDFPKIGFPNAWNLTKGGSSVIVATIDTGIDYNHQDFAGRTIIRGPNYAACLQRDAAGHCVTPGIDPFDDDQNGHGTHVAGTIGAVTNNTIGVAGINWNVKLMAIKSMDSKGKGSLDDVINGLQYAMSNQVNVINMSVAIGTPSVLHCATVMPELQDTINDAVNHKIVVVSAAGNDDEDANQAIPAACSGTIVVGATDQNDSRWSGSNYGSRVDISAPGVHILSTFPGNKYAYKDGTSMAAPHISAVAALILSVNPNLSASQVKNCITQNTDPISTDKPIGGRLNAQKAIAACVTLTPAQIKNSGPKSGQIISVNQDSVTVKLTDGTVQTFKISQSQKNNMAVGDNISFSVSENADGSVTAQNISQNNSAPIPQGSSTNQVQQQVNKPPSTPVKTYSCGPSNTVSVPKGAIKIGNLVCTPN